MTFSLSADYAPIVAINSIAVSSSPSNGESLPSNWDSNPQTLLDASQADLFTIDSSTPFLWLPEAACDTFANALNLTYDQNLQLYLFPDDNSSSPDTLKAWNLTFTFTLSNLPRASNEIDLALPYDAFNLQLSYPFPNLPADFTSPPTNYFPLRRAANSTQYTIGRAFLQETYLAVDYERSSFTLSQAVFTLDAVSNVNLLSISRPKNSTWPGSPGSGLSRGAKAGIGVGAAVGALIMVSLVWLFCFRKRKDSKNVDGVEKVKRSSLLSRLRRAPDSKTSVSELLGDKRHPTEVPADSSVTRFELSGSTPSEMPAAPVSPSFFASNESSGQRGLTRMRNDPRSPVELENQGSVTKATEAGGGGSERSDSPVPPYSQAEINNNRFSSSVSPYSVRNSRGFGTVSSGEQGISPVGANSGGHSRKSSGSNSNSNSRSMSSPVSPDITSRPQHPFSTGGSSSPSTNSNSNSLLVPQVNGRPVSRSPSTGSRFVEEGLTTVTEERATSPTPRSSPRFSWEQ